MRLGISAETFARPTLAATLEAVAGCGLGCIELGAGLLNHGFPGRLVGDLRRNRLSVAAVSGAFNVLHPDPSRRREGLRRLEELASHCAVLAAPIITLNAVAPESAVGWPDLLASMDAAVKIAERHDVRIAIGLETGGLLDSARKARRLLDELGSHHLRIVMDPASLIGPANGPEAADIVDEAFQLLGPDIGLARAGGFGGGGNPLDWPRWLRLFETAGYDGPLILRGLAEKEINPAIVFLRETMKTLQGPAPVPVEDVFHHDGMDFHFQTYGFGAPFFFGHGLGADMAQPFALFRPPSGIRLIGFDCRAHGRTTPVGPPEKISLATFAEDLLALMDHMNIEKAVVGGISMGAAVALNFAVRHPKRLLGLVLVRPAWLDGPRQDSAAVFSGIAALLREHGAEKGLLLFKQSEIYQRALAAAPAAAQSLASQFLRPRAEETVARLERIPRDAPVRDRRQWRAIAVPTLVLANDRDAIHPLEYGLALAREIPGAEFRELTPKAISIDLHREEAQHYLETFLLRHF